MFNYNCFFLPNGYLGFITLMPYDYGPMTSAAVVI